MACHLCKQLGHFARDCTRMPSGSTVPPPPPPPPNAPAPPPLPFTSHTSMITRLGGALWHSVRQVLLPASTEQGLTPIMYRDPVAEVPTLQIEQYLVAKVSSYRSY
jgi:hypothetical protein